MQNIVLGTHKSIIHKGLEVAHFSKYSFFVEVLSYLKLRGFAVGAILIFVAGFVVGAIEPSLRPYFRL